jgi:hypothetical protein
LAHFKFHFGISLIKGKNLVEYADKTVLIEKQGILFATPKIPYRYTPQSTEQSGVFIDVVPIPYLPTQKAHFIAFCVGFGSALFFFEKRKLQTCKPLS